MSDIFASLKRQTFEALVSGLEEQCRDSLTKAGYDPDRAIAFPAKRWKGRTKYAYEILKYLGSARDGIERGHAEYAAIYALKLGLKIREDQLLGLARLGKNMSVKVGSKESQTGTPRGRPRGRIGKNPSGKTASKTR